MPSTDNRCRIFRFALAAKKVSDVVLYFWLDLHCCGAQSIGVCCNSEYWGMLQHMCVGDLLGHCGGVSFEMKGVCINKMEIVHEYAFPDSAHLQC